MDKIKYHIQYFIIGVLFGIFIVYCLFVLTGTIDKIDKIYSMLDPEKVNLQIETLK